MKTIDDFRQQDYRFLGNFFECDIELDGDVYPTLEHAFQASKTASQIDRDQIRTARTPRRAKRIGRSIAIASDWDDIRVDVMHKLLAKKFEGSKLKKMLLATKNAELVSGGDTFWGKVNDQGTNHIGEMLMKIRTEMVKDAASDLDDANREFLESCCWSRDPDGDSMFGECWTPPWNEDCQYSLGDAVNTARPRQALAPAA